MLAATLEVRPEALLKRDAGVSTWMAPPNASLPNCALAGPSMTSTRCAWLGSAKARYWFGPDRNVELL